MKKSKKSKKTETDFACNHDRLMEIKHKGFSQQNIENTHTNISISQLRFVH
jgi:hypothetical protein